MRCAAICSELIRCGIQSRAACISLLAQHKVDNNIGYHFYRLTIQDRRPVLPLQDRLLGSFYQKRMPANQLQIPDIAFFVDDRLKLDGTGNTSRPCQRWIDWLDLPDQLRGHHLTANAHRTCRRLRFRRRRWRRRSGAWYTPNYATQHTAYGAPGLASTTHYAYIRRGRLFVNLVDLFGNHFGRNEPVRNKLPHHRFWLHFGSRRRRWRRWRRRRRRNEHALQLSARQCLRVNQRNENQNADGNSLQDERQRDRVGLSRLLRAVNESLLEHISPPRSAPASAGLLLKILFLFVPGPGRLSRSCRCRRRLGSRRLHTGGCIYGFHRFTCATRRSRRRAYAPFPTLGNTLPEDKNRAGNKNRRIRAHNNANYQRKGESIENRPAKQKQRQRS